MSTEEKKDPQEQSVGGGTAQQAPAEESPDLTITDLNNIRSIIDVATQRGAFKASELEAVGRIYNRLDKFLNAATKGQ